jgi:CDP-diglyceride synthetase
VNPVLWVGWVAFHLVGAGLALLVRRKRGSSGESLQSKFVSFLLITGGVLLIGAASQRTFIQLMLLLGLSMWSELKSGLGGSHRDARNLVTPVGAAYVVIGILSACWIKHLDVRGDAWGWFWTVVAITDSYAQLFGQLHGEAKMAPRISPGKTWFGFFAGTLSAVLAGLLVKAALYPAPLWAIVLVALATSLAATAGDLLESWMKRMLGLKDFSNKLGKHGGLLDRFDSLLGAAPVFALLFWWLLR